MRSAGRGGYVRGRVEDRWRWGAMIEIVRTPECKTISVTQYSTGARLAPRLDQRNIPWFPNGGASPSPVWFTDFKRPPKPARNALFAALEIPYKPPPSRMGVTTLGMILSILPFLGSCISPTRIVRDMRIVMSSRAHGLNTLSSVGTEISKGSVLFVGARVTSVCRNKPVRWRYRLHYLCLLVYGDIIRNIPHIGKRSDADSVL